MTPTDKKHIRIWYWCGAVMVLLILIIGGITRLTQSGLSMVEWNPVMGIIPPLSESDWADVFERYRQFPEYRELNRGMSLEEFKFIFFWEYLHRMAGRLIGLVFIIPFGFFLIKKKISPKQIRRALLLFGLGLVQGVMGWFMVQSGLVDVPFISPYRLAVHLLFAFAIFGCCIWFALDLYPRGNVQEKKAYEFKRWMWLFMGLLILQVVWGAIVAGLHAGHVYNTFPKMNQYWIPPEAWLLEPFIRNLYENIAAVQWIHRLLGTLLAVTTIGLWARMYLAGSTLQTKMWGIALLALILLQYVSGVFTLLYHVPVSLGVLHQAMAMVLFGVAVGFMHFLCKSDLERDGTHDMVSTS